MDFKNYIIFFSLLCIMQGYSQKVDSDTLIDNIKRDVTTFFLKQNILDENVVKNDLNYVFINEIFDGKVIGYNINGIYNIGVHQSHSKKHIMIKEGDKYIIYNLKEIDVVLLEILNYSIRNKLVNDKMLFYFKNVLQKYEDNYHYKHTSIEKKEDKN
jgi:hypothetical protein